MWRYILRRVILLVPLLILISIVTFGLVRLLPGDPARLQLGPFAPEEGVQRLRTEQRLDEPLPTQYLAYVQRLLNGDLGRSWVNSTEVADDLKERVPATLELMAAGLLLIFTILLPLGIITAAKEGGILTRMAKRVASWYGMLAGALPDFWLGLMLILVFFSVLGISPGPTGRLGILDVPPDRITGFYTIDSLLQGDIETFVSAVAHLALPAITLAFVYGAPIYKMARSTMETALRADYTTYAEALGLPTRRVRWYAFRFAAPPTVVMVGVVTGFLLGGAVLIEMVFNISGIGRYAVQAITTADYAPIQAFVLVAAVFTMVVYLAVDLVQFAIDPRVRPAPRSQS